VDDLTLTLMTPLGHANTAVLLSFMQCIVRCEMYLQSPLHRSDQIDTKHHRARQLAFLGEGLQVELDTLQEHTCCHVGKPRTLQRITHVPARELRWNVSSAITGVTHGSKCAPPAHKSSMHGGVGDE
jgi:hypothetical protein